MILTCLVSIADPSSNSINSPKAGQSVPLRRVCQQGACLGITNFFCFRLTCLLPVISFSLGRRNYPNYYKHSCTRFDVWPLFFRLALSSIARHWQVMRASATAGTCYYRLHGQSSQASFYYYRLHTTTPQLFDSQSAKLINKFQANPILERD